MTKRPKVQVSEKWGVKCSEMCVLSLFTVMQLYAGSVQYVVSLLLASLCYFLITGLMFFNILCTGWHTKGHTTDCTHNTFLLLQKHLTSGTELILTGWNCSQRKSVNCLFARSPPCTKVCTKTSLSRYYILCFCIKQYNFHLLI